MASTRSAIVASYRAVYKAGLAAVQHSSPARFAIRDKVRKAFRSSDASQFSQQRVDNTVEFLKIAGKRKGIEHDIVRNLCLVHYWQVMGKKVFVRPMESRIIDTRIMCGELT